MKQKTRGVAPSSLPTKLPLWQTIVLYLLLWWVLAIYSLNREESRDVPGFGDI